MGIAFDNGITKNMRKAIGLKKVGGNKWKCSGVIVK